MLKIIEYIGTEDGKKVYEVVADKITELGNKCTGECGYTAIGGVIGCTHVDEGKKIRANYNNMFFLIPGYGAQGGTAEDVSIIALIMVMVEL